MAVLEVHNIGFGYGADRLFSNVTFSLESGERAAIVAPNGAGKTTLLRLVEQKLAPDEGSVVMPKTARIASSRQSHELFDAGTVLDAFFAGFGEIMEIRRALRLAEEKAASGETADLERLAHLSDRHELAGGDELERRVSLLAERLGFTPADLERPVSSLSGGERGRLELGVALASEADLILLDEPTNHLDIETIEWLEKHLKASKNAALVVSHDRAFLDAVCPRTLELGRRMMRNYRVCYSQYVEARAEELVRERKLKDERDAFVEKTEDFIRKNLAGQKTKQAKSRQKMLDKLEDIEAPEDIWAAAERVGFRFAEAPRPGDIVLDIKGARAERGGRILFEGLDLLVRRGERIGIVGPNGAGKTTLLKLLAGMGESGDTAEIRRGTNLREGYFDQRLGGVDPSRSAVEEIRSVRGTYTVEAAREYLARFRFYGDHPLRKVSGFSGGERSRLALAKLLLEPRNLLFLDEPTNHLDIPAAEVLEEALAGFAGSVILVSHDRRFLEQTTTRIVALGRELGAPRESAGIARVFNGGYRDVAKELSRERQQTKGKRPDASAAKPVPAPQAKQPSAPPNPKPTSKPQAKPAASLPQPLPGEDPITFTVRRAVKIRRSSTSDEVKRRATTAHDGLRRRAGELERDLAEKRRKLEGLRTELRDHPGGDFAHLARLAGEEQALSKRVEEGAAELRELQGRLGQAVEGSS